MLDANEYSLLLTEAPDVPPDELRAAIRWRIKDLIDFHINDATLDVFDLPGEKAAGRARSMYAVAARSSAIQKRADMMSAAGINLDVIDIPEMAQRNLAALLPEDAKGVVLLSFTSGGGLITISKQSEIYLSRNIDIGLDMMASFQDTNELFDRIALEVQRSLDYYDSHFRQAPITTIALAPMPREVPGLVEYLKANLSASVITMDLTKLMECEAELKPELQSALPRGAGRGAAAGGAGAVSQQINLYQPIFRKEEKKFSAVAMLQSVGLVAIGVAAAVCLHVVADRIIEKRVQARGTKPRRGQQAPGRCRGKIRPTQGPQLARY